MKDDERTQIMNNDATQIIDDDSTQIYDADATQVMEQNIKTLNEIVKGDVIQGYTIGDPISEKGGEAVIRLAEKDGKKYVIKVFRSGHSTDCETEDILVNLKSSYVMPIVDRGDYKEIHYEILPFYHNGTFGDLSGEGASLDKLMLFINDVNEGLHAIHCAKVFHNDIKPSNIFISDDKKNAVIGDFGISRFNADRTHVTNTGNMTGFYAAPEAGEISNEKTDYFSFGMSIAYIAFGKNLFQGFTDKNARAAILLGRISLPKEIPEDVRDLITMLTQYAPQDRITYDGVKRWLSDTKCFAGCSYLKSHTEQGLIINGLRFGKGDEKREYRDTYSLAVAINDNPKLAMEQREIIVEAIVNAVGSAPKQDPQLQMDLKKIQEKHKNDFQFCLFLMLHTLNPYLTIKFAGKEMRDFQDYIDMLKNDYGKQIDEHFAREEFINVVLSHSSIPEKYVELIRLIMKSYQKPLDLYDILVNLFGDAKIFFYNNCIYDSFGDFLNHEAFSPNGVPNAMKWETIRKEFLFEYLKKLGADDESIKSIIDEKDKTTEYFMLGKLLNGYIPFMLCSARVKNFFDLVELIAHKKESQKNADLEMISNYLNKNGYLKIIQFEKKPLEKELIEGINKAKNKVSYIYYYCHTGAKFLYCVTINQLIELLGKTKSSEIEEKSSNILASDDFRIWMAKQGVRV